MLRREFVQKLTLPATSAPAAGVRIPFWFLTNDKGKFTAGMRVDWSNDGDGVTVSTLVSSPLSLLTN